MMTMKHIFKKATDTTAPLLLLLHGTGGNEHDLFPIADAIDPTAAKLGVRGNVLEHGMSRFFKRLSEGVFDEEDLILRTNELYEFLNEASVQLGFDRDNVVAIGYSNGANIAASLLFHRENSLKGAILHHPMVPRRGIVLPDMSDLPVFIGAGRNDQMCPPSETEDLHAMLEDAGAMVTVHWENQGHQLTNSEISAAAEWYRQKSIGGNNKGS